jgi:acyl-CoA dehydrogenase
VWEFATDTEFQSKLDWADRFVRDEVEPLDLVLGDPSNRGDERAMRLARPLMDEVRVQGLWACHLGPHLGGAGLGQLNLVLLNEILGRSRWAPTIFGCQAPDSGNSEILAQFGTSEQKERYLAPLLDGRVSSCFSMTEPHAGSDPSLFTTRAVKDGDEWVINGEKWFTSNARYADFLLLMAVTDPDAAPSRRMTIFVLPHDTAGIEYVRHSGTGGSGSDHHSHTYIRYTDVRVAADAVLGQVGDASAIAQARLGGGRIHQAGRAIAQMRRAFDLMCERAVSRNVKAGRLGDLQMTQEKVADTWVEIEQFRLLVLRTAWLIDQHDDYSKVRRDIAAVKVAMSRIYTGIVLRALHLHGAIGVSDEMPFAEMLIDAEIMAIGDGPIEVHQQSLSRQLLRGYEPGDPVFPSAHVPTQLTLAEAHVREREGTR